MRRLIITGALVLAGCASVPQCPVPKAEAPQVIHLARLSPCPTGTRSTVITLACLEQDSTWWEALDGRRCRIAPGGDALECDEFSSR